MRCCAAGRKEREKGAANGWGLGVGERGQRACGLRRGSVCGRAVSGRWTRGAGRGARRAGRAGPCGEGKKAGPRRAVREGKKWGTAWAMRGLGLGRFELKG